MTVEGGDLVEMTISSGASIARMKSNVAEKLASLKGIPLELITLHLRRDGGVLEALSGELQVSEALAEGSCVVAKVIGALAHSVSMSGRGESSMIFGMLK